MLLQSPFFYVEEGSHCFQEELFGSRVTSFGGNVVPIEEIHHDILRPFGWPKQYCNHFFYDDRVER